MGWTAAHLVLQLQSYAVLSHASCSITGATMPCCTVLHLVSTLPDSWGHCLLCAISFLHSTGDLEANTEMSLSSTATFGVCFAVCVEVLLLSSE